MMTKWDALHNWTDVWCERKDPKWAGMAGFDVACNVVEKRLEALQIDLKLEDGTPAWNLWRKIIRSMGVAKPWQSQVKKQLEWTVKMATAKLLDKCSFLP